MTPEVSVCIPAWQSEPFIRQTLEHACSQSHARLRILVSVDKCEDNTLEICQRIAAREPRIQVFEQDTRQGWAGNVNFLLEQVDTPLFVFYWHDDLIGQDYVERLATGLAEHPNATSAYGATRHFGAWDWLDDHGRSFFGSTAERLFEVLIHPELFGLTRCMMRRELIVQGLEIPTLDGRDYYENNNPFWLKILASGPVLYVPAAEYRRRNGAGGSVVDGWLRFPRDRMLEGMRQNVTDCMKVVRDSLHDPFELELITYSLYLFIMGRVRLFESRAGHSPLTDPGELADEFLRLRDKDILPQLDQQQRWAVANAQARLCFLEGKYWRKRSSPEKALAKFAAAMALNPHFEFLTGETAQCLVELGYPDEARMIHARLTVDENDKAS